MSETPGAVPIEGGTDVMVELNFDRARPPALLNLNEVGELKGWSGDNGALRLGASLTYDEAMEASLAERLPALAEASRTVGSPQIRNRGTIGGNLGTASPAGDALPPLLIEDAEVELASVRGVRRMPVREFLVGPKQNALEEDELIVAVLIQPSGSSQTFMKIGPRNAMVIAVCSLALSADRERGELRASFGSAGPVTGLVTAQLDERESFPERVAEAASPIDDVRGTAEYRRHALRDPDGESARPRPGVNITVTVNGERHEAEIWPGESLLFALRERMGLPGSKNACEQGECGSCSVLLDGKLVCACLVLAAQVDGHEIVTVEGVGQNGELHAVQEAFVETGAVQCGFCTPGLIVATVDLLRHRPEPTDDEIREALSGNLCRCTGYAKIFDAVRLAAARLCSM